MDKSPFVSIGLILIGLLALMLIPIMIGKVKIRIGEIRTFKGFKASAPGFRIEIEEVTMEGGSKD
jgi:hypothetical protein